MTKTRTKTAVHVDLSDSAKATTLAYCHEMASKRITSQTRAAHEQYWVRFADFCRKHPSYEDPRQVRFALLPEAIMVYVGMQTMALDRDGVDGESNRSCSMNMPNKIRAAISDWFRMNPDRAGDTWFVEGGVGVGNLLQSSDVKAFYAGLVKDRRKTHITKRAAPMSPQMLRMVFEYLDQGRSEFPETASKWFKAVTSLAFYACARISEVLNLTTSNFVFDLSRPSINGDQVITWYEYRLTGRKTESGDERRYNLHYASKGDYLCAKTNFDAWYQHAIELRQYNFANDPIFPALKMTKNPSSPTLVKWGITMNESSVITLLNRIVSSMLTDVTFVSTKKNSMMKPCFENIHFTTHTFRRGFAQYKFFHEEPSKRWSLKMLKWWGGWSDDDLVDVIMKYLLDSVYQVGDELLSDTLAPDQVQIEGCPTTWLTSTHDPPLELTKQSTATHIGAQIDAINSLEASLKKHINEAISMLQPVPKCKVGESSHVVINLENPSNQHKIQENPKFVSATPSHRQSILPPTPTWQDHCHFYFVAAPAKELHVPVKDFTRNDGIPNRKQRTRLSTCRSIGRACEAVYKKLVGNQFRNEHLLPFVEVFESFLRLMNDDMRNQRLQIAEVERLSKRLLALLEVNDASLLGHLSYIRATTPWIPNMRSQ